MDAFSSVSDVLALICAAAAKTILFLKVLPGQRVAVIAPRGVICGFVHAANQPVDRVDSVLWRLIAPGFRALVCGLSRSLPPLLSLSGTCLWFWFILPFV